MRIKHRFTALLAIGAFAPAFAFAYAAPASTCVNVTANLLQGMTDATTGGQVRVLQNYLYSAGYLSATPNGVFGPATAAAVRSFQSANGISNTGSVASLTRAAISIKSCLSGPVETSLPPKPTSTLSAPSAIPVVTIGPIAGQTLGIGDSYTVKWSGPSNITYNVVLEDSSGVAQGFIVAGSYSNQYSWQVASVNNSSSASQIVVPPGTYRVHVEDASVGPQSSDRPGGTFTISGNINVSQVFPRTVAADGNTTIILYGSGFNANSLVYIYGYGNTPPYFVSPDGRAIAFTMPTGTSPGSHTVSVLNTYGTTNNVTVESNQTSITVLNP